MLRFLVTLEYRGGEFHGFQRQPGLATVQGALEAALLRLTGEEIRVRGAGRTDAGVHALGQAAAFDVPDAVAGRASIEGLNALLPAGVAVTSIRPVPAGFDPRRNASWREYRYFILNRPSPSALLEGFTYHFKGELDRGVMRQACAAFVGERDFSAFRVRQQDESSVRTVVACELEEILADLLCVRVRADSFLYKMVRIMAGAVVAAGSGRMSVEDIRSSLEAGASRPCVEPLPPHGLFLWRVEYSHLGSGTLT